jgi:hypothetical protein
MLTAKNISYELAKSNQQISSAVETNVSNLFNNGIILMKDIEDVQSMREIVFDRNPLSSWTLGSLNFENW